MDTEREVVYFARPFPTTFYMSTTSEPKLILGLPKGSLESSTYELFRKAGFNIKSSSRSYVPRCDDPEIEIRYFLLIFIYPILFIFKGIKGFLFLVILFYFVL